MRVSIRTAGACAGILAASLLPHAAFAEGHLPILTISPIASWTTPINSTGTPSNLPIEGQVEVTGTATIPVYKGLSLSYDRLAGGLFNTTFDGVSLPGVPNFQPGAVHDIVHQFRIDNVFNRYFTVEAGLQHRYRVCCTAGSSTANDAPTSRLGHASTENHIGYLGITYTTPNFKALNYSVLVFNLTGSTANHNPSPAALAAFPPGQDIGNKREYGVTVSGTFVLPISVKYRLTGTATYLHGGPDFFEDQPFPYRYNVTAFSLIQQLNPYLGFQAGWQQAWQQPQGAPFPLPSVIHASEFTAQLDVHLDFNKFFAQPKASAPGSI